MSENQSFHEVRFPTDLALGAAGGPERRTEVVTMGSGQEQRNARWAHSRRKYNVGYGIKTITDLQTVIEFFEERRGRLYGFRFRDPLDWKSSKAGEPINSEDQFLGMGDGANRDFQLVKQYGSTENGYKRKITKPLAETVLITIGETVVPQPHYELDSASGLLTFDAGHVPQVGQEVRAGFEFDIPVRFDADEISVNLSHFEAGDIPSIPLSELLQ